MSTAYFHSQLPWASAEQDNRTFTRITYVILGVTLLAAMAVQWVKVPEQSREQKAALPPQLARIIQPKVPPPVPKVEPEPIPKPPPVEKEKPTPVEVEKPKVVNKPSKPKPESKPEPTQAEKIQQAKETANQSGLLAFKDEFAGMRNELSLANIADTQTVEGAGKAEQTSRKRIGSESVGATSGGLKNATISQDIGARGELAGRRTTEFNAPEAGAASLAAKRIQEESQVVGDRDVEQIRKTLDANKGAVYALYRRALRQNPDLEGKVTVRLTIEPDGSLSGVTLMSSELDDADLEQKLLTRIRMINFGLANVKQTQLEYGFNFLPY